MVNNNNKNINVYNSGDEEEQDNEYYGFLNVRRDASEAEITAAYKRLARLYHPDKHQVINRLISHFFWIS